MGMFRSLEEEQLHFYLAQVMMAENRCWIPREAKSNHSTKGRRKGSNTAFSALCSDVKLMDVELWSFSQQVPLASNFPVKESMSQLNGRRSSL